MRKRIIAALFYILLEVGAGIFIMLSLTTLVSGHVIREVPFDATTLVILFFIVLWRIYYHLKSLLPVESIYLFQRFIWFMLSLLTCYLLSAMYQSKVVLAVIPMVMWAGFGVFILGLSYFYLTKLSEHRELTAAQMISRLAPIYGIGIIAGFAGVLSYFLFPWFRKVLQLIPTGLYYLLLLFAKRLEWFFNMVASLRKPVTNQGEEVEVDIENSLEELLQTIEPTRTTGNTLETIFLVIASLLLIAAIVFLIIKRKKLIGIIVNQNSAPVPVISTIQPGLKVKEDQSRKSRNIQRDKVRRMYQTLLEYANKHGVEIKLSDTARNWTERTFINQELTTSLKKITELYERKRYSQSELSNSDVEEFEKEIKQVKKELQSILKNQKR